MKDTSQNGFEIRTTSDYEAIRRLALASGLEDGSFQLTVAAFGCYLHEDLVGCATLRRDGERYSVDWLAVSERMRGRGLGNALVAMVEKEARRRGAIRLWALARSPEFFEKIGFRRSVADEGIGPGLNDCLVCRQYLKSCFPATMMKDL